MYYGMSMFYPIDVNVCVYVVCRHVNLSICVVCVCVGGHYEKTKVVHV